MRFIDTHSHIYDTGFQEDMDAVMVAAKSVGIEKIYMPGIDTTCIDGMMDMETKYPGFCIPMMGLHPCYVKENYQEELAIVEGWLTKRKFAAIGEIGLDYYWDKTFAKEQQLVFEKQMQWGLDYGLPINIHTRNAMGETIEMVKPFAKKGLKGIFHCFSGSKESAEQIVEMGFLLGLGGVLTYKNAGVAEAVVDIPMEFLVLETDAPYLSPVPFRGKPNSPKNIPLIAQKLADLFEIPLTELVQQTNQNANKLKATSGY